MTITNDTKDAVDESMNLRLVGFVKALLGNPATATLTVLDDDLPPSVRLSANAYTVTENIGTVTVTVSLSAPSSFNVIVYCTVGSTSSRLAFAPGVLTRTFTMAVIDDTKDEANEVIPLALVSPTNATLGMPATARLTVLDDDPLPTVQFSASTYTAIENVGTAVVNVTLIPASGLTVTVPYTAGSAGGQLSFGPGVTLRTISIAVMDDAKDEPNELIPLALFNPSNATLGRPVTATLAVMDNDLPPSMLFSASAYTVAETAGAANVTGDLERLVRFHCERHVYSGQQQGPIGLCAWRQRSHLPGASHRRHQR